jgi:hypothetical protein
MGVDYNMKVKDIAKLCERNWAKWSRDIGFSFMEAGLAGYLDGTIEELTETKKLAKWKQYNSRIIGTLGRVVDDSLAQELTSEMTAAEAWLLLKRRTQQDGMVAKLNAMRVAITMKFSSSKLTNTIISDKRNHQ